MKKRTFLTAIASGALALTIGFAQAKAAEQHDTATTKEHTSITMVSSSQAVKISGKYHVTANSLTLRKAPSLTAGKLGYFKKNNTVNASYKKVVSGRTWLKVSAQGKTGWMSAAYLKAGAGVKTTSSNTNQSDIINTAKNYLGVPYVYGGTTPAGFDCSGFTRYVLGKHGVTLPRTSRQQRTALPYTSNPQPGDLVFFNVGGGAITHVAIYAGNGMIVHAAGSHVQYQTMSTYWKNYIHSYGSIR